MQAEPRELTSCGRNAPCWDLTHHTLWHRGAGGAGGEEGLAGTEGGNHFKPQAPAFPTFPTQPDGSGVSCALGLVLGERQGHPEAGEEKDPSAALAQGTLPECGQLFQPSLEPSQAKGKSQLGRLAPMSRQ